MSGIDEMVESLRGLAKLPERTAQIAAPLVEEALQQSAGAGTSPDGQPWAPTKKGGRAMAGAAKAIAAKAFGNVVRVTLTGPEVFWHYGARGAPRRPVIPDGGGGEIPEVVGDALEKASDKAFREITGGRHA